MIKRLVMGIVKGGLVGAAVAAGLSFGLGIVSWSAPYAYAAGALTGVLTALVSGKALWVRGAKVENGIKAVVSIGLASLVIFAIRKWGTVSVDLSALSAGAGQLGELPAATLPIVGAALSLFFEVDNLGEASKERLRVAGPERAATKTRVGEDSLADEELGAPPAERRRAGRR